MPKTKIPKMRTCRFFAFVDFLSPIVVPAAIRFNLKEPTQDGLRTLCAGLWESTQLCAVMSFTRLL